MNGSSWRKRAEQRMPESFETPRLHVDREREGRGGAGREGLWDRRADCAAEIGSAGEPSTPSSRMLGGVTRGKG